MRKRRLFGLLLIAAAVLAPFVLWWQGINCIEYTAGPEIIEGGDKTASSEWVVSTREDMLRPNLLALLPTIAFAASGLILLFVPSRRG